MYADSFRLRFEKNDLIDSLVREKARVEQLNENLEKEISERKRAEEAFRGSESRFRVLLDSAPFGLSVTSSADGRFE